MTLSVTSPLGVMPSKVADLMIRFRSVIGPSCAGANGSTVTPPEWSVMKKLVEYGRDDHPEGDPERAQLAWAVAAMDDCDECGDLRVELTLEEAGNAGAGMVGHFAPATVRQ